MLRANSGTRKKRIGDKKQGLLRSKSEAASNLPAATAEVPSHTAPREEGIAHLRQALPTRDNPAHFPAPACQQWFFLVFLPLDPANEGAHGEKSLPFLLQVPAKTQVRLPFLVPRQQRGPAAALTSCRAGAFPSWVASQQTCCCSWRRSRAAPVCRCYPSLPARAGSGLWPHTDPGTWLISSQLEVKGCQSQGAAPRQQGDKKPAARLAVLGDV